ncbi:hypothetical protein C8Q74DRAFT_260767 [Fomes fomentarius]|nr:hypothetical protein C8Q74DRAFT_260767 [Fomes fomentarius]
MILLGHRSSWTMCLSTPQGLTAPPYRSSLDARHGSPGTKLKRVACETLSGAPSPERPSRYHRACSTSCCSYPCSQSTPCQHSSLNRGCDSVHSG